MTDRLFKFLDRDGSCRYAPGQRWSLPRDDGPGDWMPPIEGELRHRNAYHVFRGCDVLLWSGQALFEVEGRGDLVLLPSQILLREARLLRQVPLEEIPRLFREQ